MKYIVGNESQVSNCQKEITSKNERKLEGTLCCVWIGDTCMNS